MAFTPAQPDQSSPTWGQAYGLLSFQITGVLVASAVSYLFKIEAEILSSVVVTILFSALYARFAETKVPGALSQRRLRLGIAFRASFLLALLSLVAVGIYDGPRLIESGRIGVRAFLIAVYVCFPLNIPSNSLNTTSLSKKV